MKSRQTKFVDEQHIKYSNSIGVIGENMSEGRGLK